MKKILKIAAVAGMIAGAALSFMACGEETEYEAFSTLSGTSLTATAYPGAVILEWTAVPSAGSYNVYRRIAGTTGDVSLSTATTNTYYVDTLWNEKETKYTYTVEAVPANTISHNASTSSTTATTIAVPTGTSALSLSKYEKNADTAFDLTAKNITVAKLGANTVVVTFPAKAYLTYTVSLGTKNAQNLTTSSNSTTYYDDYNTYSTNANNTYGKVSLSAVTAGEKEVVITASPRGSYLADEKLTAATTVTVAKLTTSTNTTGASATYLTSTKARVSWTPAKLTNGDYAKASDYTVYRAAGLYGNYRAESLTPVATVVDSSNYNGTAPICYVDDTLTDNTVDYRYIIVLTKDESIATATANLSAYTTSTVPVLSAANFSTVESAIESYLADDATDAQKEAALATIKSTLASGTNADAWYYTAAKARDDSDNEIEDAYTISVFRPASVTLTVTYGVFSTEKERTNATAADLTKTVNLAATTDDAAIVNILKEATGNDYVVQSASLTSLANGYYAVRFEATEEGYKAGVETKAFAVEKD